MFRLLNQIIKTGQSTSKDLFPQLNEFARGLPLLSSQACRNQECTKCADICPTKAISLDGGNKNLKLDLGSCIGCGYCIDICPEQLIQENKTTKLAFNNRQALVLSKNPQNNNETEKGLEGKNETFRKSVAIRVVSTGCTACDLELSACGNPIFDMERFGVKVVASPRYADILAITGPCGLGMQKAILSCYEAMPGPKAVIAVGSCAISGGLHKNGYAKANGLARILPVDVFIPGCPPQPWQIIYGINLARQKLDSLK